jgi:hypothetical protein
MSLNEQTAVSVKASLQLFNTAIYCKVLALSCRMKFLLKQLQTGRFLMSRDQRTFDSAGALDFRTAPSATDYPRINGYQEPASFSSSWNDATIWD